jgi:hypothetical protein
VKNVRMLVGLSVLLVLVSLLIGIQGATAHTVAQQRSCLTNTYIPDAESEGDIELPDCVTGDVDFSVHASDSMMITLCATSLAPFRINGIKAEPIQAANETLPHYFRCIEGVWIGKIGVDNFHIRRDENKTDIITIFAYPVEYYRETYPTVYVD